MFVFITTLLIQIFRVLTITKNLYLKFIIKMWIIYHYLNDRLINWKLAKLSIYKNSGKNISKRWSWWSWMIITECSLFILFFYEFSVLQNTKTFNFAEKNLNEANKKFFL